MKLLTINVWSDRDPDRSMLNDIQHMVDERTEVACRKAMLRHSRAGHAAQLLPLLLFLVLPAVAHALDYTYMTSGGTVTITGYTGPGGAIVIPQIIDGKSVTGIGEGAFAYCSLTNAHLGNWIFLVGCWIFEGSVYRRHDHYVRGGPTLKPEGPCYVLMGHAVTGYEDASRLPTSKRYGANRVLAFPGHV